MRSVVVAVLGLVVLAGSARAEKVDMSPAALRDTATHVVVGEVKGVYARDVDADSWRTRHYVAEVAVRDVEKGDGIAKSSLVYARYWHHEHWLGDPARVPIGTGGHRGLPKEGETLRIYLARDAYDGFGTENKDGGFNVVGANGFERLAVPAT
jgi:hypothetical protein